MKIQSKLSRFLPLPVVFTALVLGLPVPAEAGDRWQTRMLFNPSASQLELEKRGRIMIYDGLKSAEIRRALDTQFDRIQSMMFVRTVVTDAEGEIQRDTNSGTVLVEDDGC